MKPEYESYRGDVNGAMPTSVKLPPELQDKLRLIANIEGDSVAGLLVEGAARVLQDRQSDPDFAVQAGAHLQRLGEALVELTVMGIQQPEDRMA